MPPWLGTFFMSEYYFELKGFLSIYLALNITHNLNFKTQFDPYFLRDKLINEQEEDGSWMQLVDLNKKRSLIHRNNDHSLNDHSHNYLSLNGQSLNYLSLNDLSLNGQSLNDLSLNDHSLNDHSLNGQSLNGQSLNGQNLNGQSFNGQSLTDHNLNDQNLNSMNLEGPEWYNKAYCYASSHNGHITRL